MTADEELRRAEAELLIVMADMGIVGKRRQRIEDAAQAYAAALAARSEPHKELRRALDDMAPEGKLYIHTGASTCTRACHEYDKGVLRAALAATPPAGVWQPTGEYWRARALAAEATPPAEGLDADAVSMAWHENREQLLAMIDAHHNALRLVVMRHHEAYDFAACDVCSAALAQYAALAPEQPE
jgi:hypothetical protein